MLNGVELINTFQHVSTPQKFSSGAAPKNLAAG
jgi:hypothetical protein